MVGTAIALNALSGVPLVAGVVIAGVATMLCLAIQLVGVRQLEAFIATLVALMAGCYVAQNVALSPYENPAQTLYGLAVPTIRDMGALFVAISLLGSIVQPHNLYLHSALVQTRLKGPGVAETRSALRWGIFDLALALVCSLFINVSVICVGDFVGSVVPAILADDLSNSPLRTTPQVLTQVRSARSFGSDSSCRPGR